METLLRSAQAYPGPLALVTLLPTLLLSLTRQKNAPETTKTVKKEYDYIIVGGGSAGSVLAARLSELPCVSVLLLEAGGSAPLLTEIPAINRFFWYTDIDWSYKTVSQKVVGNGLNNRQLTWPSGKVLGGSSVLNDVVYARGNRKDYDDWAEQGAEGWSYEEVLPYFLKLEDNRDPEYLANGYHAVGGPQTVHMPRYTAEFKAPLFEAAKSLGIKVVDPNGKSQRGFYDIQGILRSSRLCSTAKAYLVPADSRENLDIISRAMVRKVIFDKQRATGVQFDFMGQTYVVKARKEVILSAGAVATPKLLMLSGIGPKEELQKFKIDVIADLPVGKNLHDHIGSIENFLLRKDIPEVLLKIINPANIQQYVQNGTGILASSQLITALAFLGPEDGPNKTTPSYELYFAEGSVVLPLLDFNMKLDVFAQVYGPYVGRSFYFCLTHLLHPRSRGSITLKSTNPYDPPLIDPNYFNDPQDVKDIVEGLKACRRIGTSEPMKKFGSAPFTTLYPGCEKLADDEDRYYDCQVRSVSVSFFHPVGTAKMGRSDDPTTVVDPKLRVKGVDGLRVVDASIMPIVPSGNTNIPVIMVAEKASDIIKETIKCNNVKTPFADTKK